MEKSQYDLCLEVLRRLHRARLLKEFILIGSWAMVFYKERYKNWPRLNRYVLVTRDMDFLIDNVRKVKEKVNIPEMLEDLGFIVTFHGSKGYMKLNHPDLIIEFLTPERGKGEEGPLALPGMGVNATALRFLGYLSEDTLRVPFEGLSITLPHPARFALHKIIVAQRRKNADKKAKDSTMALELLSDLIEAGERASIQSAYEALHKQWQKRVVAGLRGLDREEILEYLQP